MAKPTVYAMPWVMPNLLLSPMPYMMPWQLLPYEFVKYLSGFTYSYFMTILHIYK